MNPQTEALAKLLLDSKAVEIRDINVGEEPFLYSSGNWGPGYVMVKGLVGRRLVLDDLIYALARKVLEKLDSVVGRLETYFVAANATGGMIPGWELARYLHMPYVYVRGTRKKGGHKELVTGAAHHPDIKKDMKALVVEELVNFAETTVNSAIALREEGYEVTHAACILFYDNPKAKQSLAEHHVELIHLLTLPEVLEVAEQSSAYPKSVIDDYRAFLADPMAWQKKYGFEPVKEGGTL